MFVCMYNQYFNDILRDMKSSIRTMIIVTGMLTCWFRQQTAQNSDHHSPDNHIGSKVWSFLKIRLPDQN